MVSKFITFPQFFWYQIEQFVPRNIYPFLAGIVYGIRFMYEKCSLSFNRKIRKHGLECGLFVVCVCSCACSECLLEISKWIIWIPLCIIKTQIKTLIAHYWMYVYGTSTENTWFSSVFHTFEWIKNTDRKLHTKA